jgi:lipoyl(octanoyl) transferase
MMLLVYGRQSTIMNRWRVFIHPPYNGAWNMAVDEAILESVSSKVQLPTLRLYDWSPYTLSLGHAQPVSDVNIAALKEHNWTLVRRPTGGRAILHADEMTYSVCAPIDDPSISGGVLESYQKISNALIMALKIIGINADSKPKNSIDSHLLHDPVCFQFPSDYEITFQEKKLIGSAQARKKNGVLQHGAIPLFGDISRIVEVLNYPDEFSMLNAKDRLIRRAITVKESFGKDISWFVLADAMIEGFEQELGLEFIKSSLSKQELSRAVQIYHEKYANDLWTMRI